jgi:ribosome-associated toxin RatA of RatAB toxin-antitoxin module
MRHVELQVLVPVEVEQAYHRLADFERYPDLADAVRKVTVTSVQPGVTISCWEVTFRSGILRWTEEDHYDDVTRRIAFQQCEGDLAEFSGDWACDSHPSGTRVTFTARIDLGIPTLADALEPIAVRALFDNTVSILKGLYGEVEVEVQRSAVTDPAAVDPVPPAHTIVGGD